MLTPAQLELRRTRVGGSEIAALIEDPITGESCHPYKTALDVYRTKVPTADAPPEEEREEDYDDGTSEEMKWGTHAEPAICSYIAEARALELVEVGSLVPTQHAHVIATPDRAGRSRGADDPRVYAVEAKNVGPHAARMWGKGDGDEAAPLGYAMQVIWEMGVLRLVYSNEHHADHGLLCASIAGAPPRTFIIPWDARAFEALVERAGAFFRDCVNPRRPPRGWQRDKRALDYLRERWAKSNGLVLEPTAEDRELALEFARLHEQQSALKKAVKEVRARLCDRIGEHEALGDLITWKSGESKSDVVCDWEAAARDLALLIPEERREEAQALLERHVRVVTTPGSRRLLVKPPLKKLIAAAPALPALAPPPPPSALPPPASAEPCGAEYLDRFSREKKTCSRARAANSERCRYHQPKQQPAIEESPHA